MRGFRTSVAAFTLLVGSALAGSAPGSSPQVPADLKHIVQEQFGDQFTLEAMPGSTTVLVTGDLDGDGQEDAVIVTKSKDPMAGQLQFNYRVIDPLDAYYGWGNPNDTLRFGAADPDRARVLLVVHAWRSSAPKAKFAIINVPFTQLAIETITLKKKMRTVISASDRDTMRSYLFWDGKRWKYEPGPLD